MNYTAIILHYWPERVLYLPRIIDGLLSSDTPPDEIIIWNNGKSVIDVPVPVIRSDKNYGCSVRYAAAFLASTQYVMFQDDDLIVSKDFLKNVEGVPDQLTGLEGRDLTGVDYQHAAVVRGVKKKVDICLGRFTFSSRNFLLKLLPHIPLNQKDDDIHASWAASKVGRGCEVVPGRWTSLEENRIGLCHEKDHYSRRNALTKKLFGR